MFLFSFNSLLYIHSMDDDDHGDKDDDDGDLLFLV